MSEFGMQNKESSNAEDDIGIREFHHAIKNK
jgi:hypothetical protein